MSTTRTAADFSGALNLLRFTNPEPSDVHAPASQSARYANHDDLSLGRGAGSVTNGAQRGAGHTSREIATNPGLNRTSMTAPSGNISARDATFQFSGLPGLRLGTVDASLYDMQAHVRELETDLGRLTGRLSSTPRRTENEGHMHNPQQLTAPVQRQSTQFSRQNSAATIGAELYGHRPSRATQPSADDVRPFGRAVSFARRQASEDDDNVDLAPNLRQRDDAYWQQQQPGGYAAGYADNVRVANSPRQRTANDSVGRDNSTDVLNSSVSNGRSYEYVARRDRGRFIKPDKFDGTSSSLETFLAQFENCCLYNGWGDSDKAAHLRASLTGPAGQLLWVGGKLAVASYEQIVDKLKQRFGAENQEEKFEVQLRCRRRRAKETLQELAQDIRRLTTLAYPNDTSRTVDRIAKEAFLNSLGNKKLELKLREREPHDLDAAFCMALRLETYEQIVDREPVVTQNSSQQELGKGSETHSLSCDTSSLADSNQRGQFSR